MEPFVMCKTCHAEYEDILDRRFHAQPVACNHCGPEYSLHTGKGIITEIHSIAAQVAEMIDQGSVISIKGVGGFHLACDAQNEKAVEQLRTGKLREGKPFAVMFRDITSAEKFFMINDRERELLNSWRRPIVILRNRTDGEHLAFSVSNGFDTTGVMIRYMPIHYMLFDSIDKDALVLTSGNISDEPVIIDNNDSFSMLKDVADAHLVYNRDIYNRTDDSVAFVVNDSPRLIRRSRGYVPNPIRTGNNLEGIFASGAELVNCFAIGKGYQAILSQYIGDLQNLETYDFYLESVNRFKKLYRFDLSCITHDLHPDYLSTRFALELAEQTGIEPIPVQHHHAHIASCMAEHSLDEKVIGVAFDGTGLGDDGTIWGGEIFICDLESYSRYSFLQPILLPGGDAATKSPWRTAVSYLYRTFGRGGLEYDLPFLENVPDRELKLILDVLDHRINSPETSSMGRLFDAVAALTNTCNHALFHAEAPMRLEQLIIQGVEEQYPYEIRESIETSGIITGIVKDIKDSVDIRIISTRFHNTIIDIIFALANKIRQETNLDKVILSGGTFQNRYLLEKAEVKLRLEGFRVYSQETIPSNDGGIALGQIVIAAKRRKLINKII